MSQGVSILVILASESLGVVLASLNRTLLRTLILMREHMGLEVLEDLTAVGVSATKLLPRLITTKIFPGSWRNEAAITGSAGIGIDWCGIWTIGI